MDVSDLFHAPPRIDEDGLLHLAKTTEARPNQDQTTDAFSEKWDQYAKEDANEQNKLVTFQRRWFCTLYGFESEAALKAHLANVSTILDAGAGLGYKAAWLAGLAPHARVIAMDTSDAIRIARDTYGAEHPNIAFVRGDIATTGLTPGCIDLTLCDQVIMHTEDPRETLKELARVTAPAGEVLCYWYARKALPRELVDDYFRANVARYSTEELWELADGLTELGRRLSDLDTRFTAPDIPLLGIKGGEYDIQRFIYWHFLKCFWSPELGEATSRMTNFDWYSPSNAKRFSSEEVSADLTAAGLESVYFHEEEACYSGRFRPVA
ncbi:class I SAM-dependent methyltransferase [Yunchengibacter salinarum]|uniref:class I SAM-dependent methyltransferase n=1 Tax=Yunchengibacter salinarum TaxID=3133399 RepID=UPI0035B6663B